MASKLWNAAPSAAPPVSKPRFGERDFIGGRLLPLLLEARQRKEDVRGLLGEEHPKGLPFGLGADLVNLASQVASCAKAVLRNVLHGGDDRGGLFVGQVIEKVLNWSATSRRSVVPPA
jgi:hypothetical protein